MVTYFQSNRKRLSRASLVVVVLIIAKSDRLCVCLCSNSTFDIKVNNVLDQNKMTDS